MTRARLSHFILLAAVEMAATSKAQRNTQAEILAVLSLLAFA